MDLQIKYGPTVPFSDEIHAQKYRGPGEGFREAMNRVSNALKDDLAHYEATRDVMLNMRFMAAGRVQAAMGSTKAVTAYNCFVSGTIADSFVEGYGSIMDRASQAAATMRMGGGIGYDFSPLRPRNALIKKLESKSSGPVSFMEIFDAVCKCIASSGHRRGAQMGVLRIDHPDIEEFIHAKQNVDKLTGFNISIGVTDEFMYCLETGKPFELKWGGEVYKRVNAQDLWDLVMRSTWDWAEPGILFIDVINRMNNLWYCETIAATNPCGEQPLPPYGACLLGSFNLVKYLFKSLKGQGDDWEWNFDWEMFKRDIPHIVRAMDNIIDLSNYPLPQQEREAKNKRRMGLGVTGLANALEALGQSYGSTGFLELEEEILRLLANEAYRASALLAKEKGAFPLFDCEKYMQSEFVKMLDDDVKDLIVQYGLRNSHLLSIAPTGTISLSADNVSSGVEPVFAYSFDRTVQDFDGARIETIHDYGVKFLGVKGKRSQDVTVDEHLAVLAVAQKWVDSAVSKTCNVPGDTSWEDFKNIYVRAWKAGCKGITTFRTDGKRGGIIVSTDDDEAPISESDLDKMAAGSDEVDIAAMIGESCTIDPRTGKKDCG
jgi:ribonucleoside-diphosphate reductase alpha chain